MSIFDQLTFDTTLNVIYVTSHIYELECKLTELDMQHLISYLMNKYF